jgi:hypothetical protein
MASTNYTNPSKNSTSYDNETENSTSFSKTTINSTKYGGEDNNGPKGIVLLESGFDVLYENGDVVYLE